MKSIPRFTFYSSITKIILIHLREQQKYVFICYHCIKATASNIITYKQHAVIL